MPSEGPEPQPSEPIQPQDAPAPPKRRSLATGASTAANKAEALEAYEAVAAEYRPALDRLGQEPDEGPPRLSDSAN